MGRDSGPHLAYSWIACNSIASGELPIWSNYFGAGTPFCQFYGFLFYYITGFVHLIVRDVFLSLKLSLGLGHIVSGLSMYYLARSRGVVKTGIPSPLGAFDELPPAVWGFTMPLKQRLRMSMENQKQLRDYDQLSALAFLLNNSVLYADRRVGESKVFIDRYELRERTPIVVFGRTTLWNSRFDRGTPITDDELAELLVRLRVDARKLSLIDLPLLSGPVIDLGTDPSCVVSDHRVRNQSVELTARVGCALFCQTCVCLLPLPPGQSRWQGSRDVRNGDPLPRHTA